MRMLDCAMRCRSWTLDKMILNEALSIISAVPIADRRPSATGCELLVLLLYVSLRSENKKAGSF